jgi:DNA-binding SARP family transcriptional activator
MIFNAGGATAKVGYGRTQQVSGGARSFGAEGVHRFVARFCLPSQWRAGQRRGGGRYTARGVRVLAGKMAAPLPADSWPAQVNLEELWHRGRCRISAPDGFLVEERLVVDLGRQAGPFVWLRPGHHQTAEDLRRRCESAPSARVLIIDVAASGASIPGEVDLVLLAPAAPEYEPLTALPVRDAALAVGVDIATTAACGLGSDVPAAVVAHLVSLTEGRAGVIDALLRVVGAGRLINFAAVLAGASSIDVLAASCTSALLVGTSPTCLSALILAARLGYAHPSLPALAPALDDVRAQPWWQPLTGGWYRVPPFWRRAILALHPREAEAHRLRMLRLIGELESVDAHAEAVELCVRTGQTSLAAEVLTGWADSSTGRDESDTRERWAAELRPVARDGSRSPSGSSGNGHDPHSGGAAWTALREACAALADARPDDAGMHAERSRSLARRAGNRPLARLARQVSRVARGASRPGGDRERIVCYLRAARFATDISRAVFPMPELATRLVADHANPVEPARSLGRPTAATGLEHRPGPLISASRQPPGVTLQRAGLSLQAHLLGRFEVQLDGVAVPTWAGGLGRSILKYLLANRSRPVTRDQLVEVIWPDASPSSSRNRLNVALHSLRADLARISSRPVVVYADGTYSLDPDIEVWLDTEAFMGASAAAELAETVEPLAVAVACAEAAAALYTGDFLEDTPYAEWAVVDRERFFVTYLDVLDRLSRVYFQAVRYTDCIDACQRLLARDRWYEPAYRLLMRCHSRQNRPHLAAQQYEQCSRELGAELGLAPDRETTRLYEAVRRRRPI